MYYLRRNNSEDIEGPYSLEYLRQMAANGKVSGSDQLLHADTHEEISANALLGVPYEAPPVYQTVTREQPEYAPQSESKGISNGQKAVIALIIFASICVLPFLLAIPAATKALIPNTDMRQAENVLEDVARAAELYCSDYDGFFPSGMNNHDIWAEQLSSYLPNDTPLEFPNGDRVEANKNLNNIRLSSVIDPYQTVMFYVLPEPGKGENAAVANVNGQVGFVSAEKLQQSVDSGIFNVPIGR